MRMTTTLNKRSPSPKMRALWLVTGVVLMTGCSSTPDGPTSMAALGALSPDISRAAPEQSVGPCGRRYDAEIGVELSLIQRMLDDDKPRSAAAHLEAGDYGLPLAWRLEGEALRAVGDTVASDRAYEALLGTCLAADGYRGLARNAFSEGRREQALALMREARQTRPIDPRIRNDLGYLLMLAGDNRAAAEEFRTALELDPGHEQAAANLVLALSRSGQRQRAADAARHFGVDARLVGVRDSAAATELSASGSASRSVSRPGAQAESEES
ncbi:hypothetical protein [Halomonas sp. RT37]|uniref:Tetratricopeptide repeat protein n=1 Tax=Halomonas sp. RT37 TaxID=2950872 RepID=A0AAU7KIQ6_9GAMM